MKLAKVNVTNFRCFESLSIPLHPDVNVFVGVNGAGKTAILDAIAVALYDVVAANGAGGKQQRASQGAALRPTDIRIHTETEDKVAGRSDFVHISAQACDYYTLPEFPGTTPEGEEKFIEWANFVQYRPPNDFSYDTRSSKRLSDIYRYFDALWKEISSSAPSALIPLPVVAYYRSDRRLAAMPKLGDIFSLSIERQDSYANALNAGANYQFTLQWYYLRENQELREKLQQVGDPAFELPDLRAMRHALQRSIENVERIFFEGFPPGLKVRLRDFDGQPQTLEIAQLSDGYRNLLAMVMDFARRLGQAHPTWDNPLEAPGILLIDEIELHLHPQWQQRIIPNLKSIFPNTQLIVATHSPQVLTTIKSESITILKDHELFSVPSSTYGAESGRLMLEVMETAKRPPDNKFAEDLRQLYYLIDEDYLEAAKELHSQLLRGEGSDDPALIEAETIIKNREWERDLGL